jgi:hypothetical protein
MLMATIIIATGQNIPVAIMIYPYVAFVAFLVVQKGKTNQTIVFEGVIWTQFGHTWK